MSIGEVKKMWSRTSSTGSSSDGKTFRLAFREGWQVTHSADATELEILNAPGLPQVRDLYPGTFVPCRSVGPVSKVGPIFSIVEIDYEGEVGPGGQEDSPINKLPEYEWNPYISTEPIDQDFDGNPIVTANNEPINGVQMQIADQELTVTRNFALFSPHLTSQYLHSVNSDTFVSYPPGTAKLIGYTAKSHVSDGFLYWKVTAKIRFRYPYNTTPDKAWYARVRHEGYYVRDSAGDEPGRAFDKKNKEPTVRPVLLASDGTRLPDGSDPEWLEFKLYQSLPYQALGLI